jgi:predicted ATP-binding protein involved in virulence
MGFRESKTIKNLKIKSKAGNVASTFQLFNFYNQGQFVEQDKELAQEYLDKVIEESKCFSFRFCEMRLVNYRRFEDLNIKLSNNNFTVIIGDNGAGKTSILEAISKSLSWFVNNFIREETTGQKLVLNDICKTNSANFATVKSTVQLTDKNNYSIELSKPKESNEAGLSGDYASFKLIAEMYRYLNSNIDEFNLPMLAYYPIERTQNVGQIQPNKIEKISNENWNSTDGYDGSLTAHQNFNRFLGWYKRLSNINLSTNNQYKNLEIDINAKVELTLMLEDRLKKADKALIPSLNALRNDLINQIAQLKKELFSKQRPAHKKLIYINNAIEIFMPNISNIRHENAPEDGFFIDKNGITLEARQLSQGERTLMALVGDIARRLVLLNPSLENPLLGVGIILIDEIELHIHPFWQQNILINLEKTFPNIQFIITTHSPQVLSTVDVKSIRKLEQGDDGDTFISIPKYQTKGITSADILAQIMGTDSIPDIYEAKALSQFLSYIEQGQSNKPEAVVLFEFLKSHFGESHPEIQYCESQIKLYKIKSKARQIMEKKKAE